MTQHQEYHYSVTIKTHDEALLNCLRALSQYAQQTGNKRIPWGGTKREDWMHNNYCATFHFSRTAYREKFEAEVSRLFSKNLYEKTNTSDSEPAIPQS